MSKNYYDILEINNNASDAEIKKAFKKLSIKWHPDKWANKSEKEKKEAEEKFKDINEAYQVLSDPQKKSNYDRFGSADGPQGFGGGGFNPFDIFGGFGGFGHRHRGPEPGRTLQYNIDLNIEEIFNGVTRKIKYTRLKRCSTCNGDGGTGVKTCPHCNGTGMITRTQRNGFSIIQNTSPCPHCNATGKTVEHTCKDCGGKCLTESIETIEVVVPPCKAHGSTITFSKMGYDSKDKHGQTGDLHFIVNYNIDKNKYAINGRDVYELIEIPYYDCILGKEITRKLPSGKEVTFNIPECCQHEQQIKLNGYGLNGGKYIFIVKVIMPTKLTDKEKEILSNIIK